MLVCAFKAPARTNVNWLYCWRKDPNDLLQYVLVTGWVIIAVVVGHYLVVAHITLLPHSTLWLLGKRLQDAYDTFVIYSSLCSHIYWQQRALALLTLHSYILPCGTVPIYLTWTAFTIYLCILTLHLVPEHYFYLPAVAQLLPTIPPPPLSHFHPSHYSLTRTFKRCAALHYDLDMTPDWHLVVILPWTLDDFHWR